MRTVVGILGEMDRRTDLNRLQVDVAGEMGV